MSFESENLLGTVEAEVEMEILAKEFHHWLTHKPHHISNVSSHNIQSCQLVEGDWGTVGSVVFWNYHHDGQPRVAKERVEAIDEDKNLVQYRVLEGDLMEHFKSFVITITVTPKKDNTQHSVAHWHMEYEKHHGEIVDPHTLLQFAVDLSKDIEAHIRENISA